MQKWAAAARHRRCRHFCRPCAFHFALLMRIRAETTVLVALPFQGNCTWRRAASLRPVTEPEATTWQSIGDSPGRGELSVSAPSLEGGVDRLPCAAVISRARSAFVLVFTSVAALKAAIVPGRRTPPASRRGGLCQFAVRSRLAGFRPVPMWAPSLPLLHPMGHVRLLTSSAYPVSPTEPVTTLT